MAYELVYTSAPRGLFPGNTGFAVVGCTRNMDFSLCKQLENLSAYSPVYPPYDSNAANNPVNFAHRIINVNGITYHILSRICYNGLDYTHRIVINGNQLIAEWPGQHLLPGVPVQGREVANQDRVL